ncbi:MAG: phosphate/phosphite/phosphonate ABC transporter substrate-binding protein [Desulfobacterales bacterium]|nr:phosphate/phosphite/phosphonate ABC transporter substrate-binding protein [Desulfobacterales bacterium]
MSRLSRILISVYLCLAVITPASMIEAQTKATREQTALTIGLIPERNIFKQIERYEPLAGYLSKKIGKNIKLKILSHYGNIIDNFVSHHLDAAFFGSFTYALAHSKLGVEAVARPVNMNGSSTYYGLIFVRKDSGIKSVKDMQGKRFAFVDRATTAGYLLPLAFFKKHGVEDYKTFFKETYFTGTHQDAIYDVLNKKAEIGAAKNTMFYRLAAKDKRLLDELVILARSPDVPENGLAVRKDIDNDIKLKLKQALINMHADPEGIDILKKFGAKKFIKTSDDNYSSVYKYVQKIGLNLSTYDYINE